MAFEEFYKDLTIPKDLFRLYHLSTGEGLQERMNVGSYPTHFLLPVELSTALCSHQPSFHLVLLQATGCLQGRGCVYIQFRTDGGLLNRTRLHFRTKTVRMLFRDLLLCR